MNPQQESRNEQQAGNEALQAVLHALQQQAQAVADTATTQPLPAVGRLDRSVQSLDNPTMLSLLHLSTTGPQYLAPPPALVASDPLQTTEPAGFYSIPRAQARQQELPALDVFNPLPQPSPAPSVLPSMQQLPILNQPQQQQLQSMMDRQMLINMLLSSGATGQSFGGATTRDQQGDLQRQQQTTMGPNLATQIPSPWQYQIPQLSSTHSTATSTTNSNHFPNHDLSNHLSVTDNSHQSMPTLQGFSNPSLESRSPAAPMYAAMPHIRPYPVLPVQQQPLVDPFLAAFQHSQVGLPVSATERTHMTFPMKLHKLLSEVAAEGKEDIISWTPSGQGCRVHDRARFIDEIVPQYFRHKSMSSFRRQLSMYGFHRNTKGPEIGAYQHALFQRDHPEWAERIMRVSRQSEVRHSKMQNPGLRSIYPP
ncbi:sequence-specific DNA binding [Mayamaea pseudoterrestris]|nr:sequence-specific DNA binding [Mayamaea pseudoterrestris]